MAFRFRCPKCNTTSFNIERDNHSYAPRGQTHELIFSCRCGKQLFGDQIEKEYMRQKAEYDAANGDRGLEVTADARKAASREREEQLQKAYEQQRAFRAQRAAEQARQDEVRRQDEDKQWRERVAAREDQGHDLDHDDHDDHDDHVDHVSSGDGSTCEWKDCNNPPRPNSKYCSRDCSNKNARQRYKRRKGSDRQEAA